MCWITRLKHVLDDAREQPRRSGAVSVRGVRRPDPREVLPAGRRQTVARQLSQVLAVSPLARLTTHLLREGRPNILQTRLLQVSLLSVLV